MNLSLSHSLSLEQNLKLEISLSQSLGEHSGDIPIYSLHRIKNILKKSPPIISKELSTTLVRNLIEANLQYKEDSGNDWSCLTSNNLVYAIDCTSKDIESVIETGVQSCPKEYILQLKHLQEKLIFEKDKTIETIQGWFYDNYDSLQYDMSGKIPFPIVCRLRSDLSRWITQRINPFDEDINQFVIDTAKESLGSKYDNAEDAWRDMGGELFR